MAWNNPNFPLFHGVMPPFVYGKGFHELWLVNEILSSDIRTVFDASNLCFSFYPENLGILSRKFTEGRNIEDRGTWEYDNNLHLAIFYGSLHFCKSFLQNAPYKVMKSSGQYYFLNEEKDRIISQATRRNKDLFTLSGCHKEKNKCSLRQFDNLTLEISTQIEYTYTLERILQIVADKEKLVILGISGESYRDMLMSWVCGLRRLGITNFLVYALDPETYEFSILQVLFCFWALTLAILCRYWVHVHIM
jgi:beta-arabinofuranosyltransferase